MGSATSFCVRGRTTYLLTAAHVVEGAGNVQVKYPTRWRTAKVLCVPNGIDLAILQLDNPSPPAVNPIAMSQGSKITSAAFPAKSMRIREFESNISDSVFNDSNVSSYPQNTYKGESGGAVLNDRDELVGVIIETGNEPLTIFVNLKGINTALSLCGFTSDQSTPIEPEPDPISTPPVDLSAINKRLIELEQNAENTRKQLAGLVKLGEMKLKGVEKEQELQRELLAKLQRDIGIQARKIDGLIAELKSMKQEFLTIQIRTGDELKTKTYKWKERVELKKGNAVAN